VSSYSNSVKGFPHQISSLSAGMWIARLEKVDFIRPAIGSATSVRG